SVDEFNVDVGVLNSSVSNFNTVLVGKPEQGLFDPREGTITIYFQNSKKELVHTLAHEFGHSLGMDHVADKRAVMYERTNELTEPSSADTIELQKACQKHTLYENLFTKANYYIKLYQ
ncbi:MAG: matrixin family metalloprotease, partial [Patescibacteria group bacterium]